MRSLALLVVAGCSVPATEIVVTIDSELGVPCTIDTLEITAGGQIETVAVTDADLPGSIVVVADDPGMIDVTVTGLRGGVPFAVASERVSFVDESSLEVRFLLDRSCVPGPCPAVGVGAYEGLPAPAERRGCGTDSYLSQDSLFVLRDACELEGAKVGLLAGAPSGEAKLEFAELPFPFTFYGVPATEIWVGSDGYLAFQQPNAASIGTSDTLGRGLFPVAAVLPFWDDLRLGPKGVCYAVSGVQPDRVLWLTWKEACFQQGPACGAPDLGFLTFSVALEETSDRIYVGYNAMTATGANAQRAKGQFATIGVTNKSTLGCATGCSAEGTCPSGAPCGYTEHSSRMTLDPLPNLELVPR
ncbi:MAG: hypothetical protein WKG01_30790 [Kofleriaceae bacterium]